MTVNGAHVYFHIMMLLLFYRKIHSREYLDEYLSRALGVRLTDGSLMLIDKLNYVLTLDYAIKMINIHERMVCGMPVVIEGETGVGKTALLEMLQQLWNESLLYQWRLEQSRLIDAIEQHISSEHKNSNLHMQLLSCTIYH